VRVAERALDRRHVLLGPVRERVVDRAQELEGGGEAHVGDRRRLAAADEPGAVEVAISSKKSICALKKNDSRGAKSSTSRPRATARSTYVNPSFSVNASSCAAVDPASRMW